MRWQTATRRELLTMLISSPLGRQPTSEESSRAVSCGTGAKHDQCMLGFAQFKHEFIYVQ